MKTKKIYGDPNGTHIKVKTDGTCRFCYTVPGIGKMTFSLLAEVGQPWMLSMLQVIVNNQLRIAPKARELNEAPWVADQLMEP